MLLSFLIGAVLGIGACIGGFVALVLSFRHSPSLPTVIKEYIERPTAEKAAFIPSHTVEDILKAKPDAKITDVLT